MTLVCLHRPGDTEGKASAWMPLAPNGIPWSKKNLGRTRGQSTGAGGALMTRCYYFFIAFCATLLLLGAQKPTGRKKGPGKRAADAVRTQGFGQGPWRKSREHSSLALASQPPALLAPRGQVWSGHLQSVLRRLVPERQVFHGRGTS